MRLQIPADLLRQVARPDNEPLREREIGEQHDERHHQLADVVKLRRLDDFAIRAVAGQQRQHNDAKRQRRQPLSGEKDQAVDGRAPVRIERHDPIHRRERQRQRVQHQPQAAQSLKARLNPSRQRTVLQVATPVENVGQRNPNGEIDNPASEPAPARRCAATNDCARSAQDRSSTRKDDGGQTESAGTARTSAAGICWQLPGPRRIDKPHRPPERYWSISSARHPRLRPSQNI